MTVRKELIKLVVGSTILASSFLGMHIYNKHINTQNISRPGYHMVSEPKGFMGHETYVQYTDGYQQVIINDNFMITIYEDSADKDIFVDKIIPFKSGRANKVGKILVRDHDYSNHQEEFDLADEKLEELASKYAR